MNVLSIIENDFEGLGGYFSKKSPQLANIHAYPSDDYIQMIHSSRLEFLPPYCPHLHTFEYAHCETLNQI
jgi:hypothetical protein